MSDKATELTPLKKAIVQIRELKAKVAEADRRDHEPIAVVGMGLRFPGGADDPESYWRLLWEGVDAITEVPADRWPIEAFYDADPDTPGKMTTRYGGFVNGVEQFDAAFFGISPREAETIDPQQRLLLEVTWEALEHAGIPADQLFGSDAGVFLGITNSDYLRLLLADHEEIDTYTSTGNLPSVAAGRLSYVLGIQGPAVSVDTACSSSLVAVHLAVQSLRRGECDLALAGGVGLILTPELTINFSRARMMAADGRCKTFDAAADGYVRSEGCAMIVLKRLSDALAASDPILAMVRGSAVNQDGRSGGLTAPNGPAQEKVVAAALADAQLPPSAVGYVETHGTGTPLGDPIEVHALGSVLCRDRSSDDPLLLGSVKTNLGHLEGAAGIAGLIKAALMLQRGAIPPHLHLSELNPHIAAEHLPISVPTSPTSWPAPERGRVAGVSSFGLSGTNAHVILSEAPPATPPAPPADERPQHVLTLSAKDASALAELAGRYAAHIAAHPGMTLADLAHSANTGRSQLTHRLAVVAADAAAVGTRLSAFAAGDPAADVISGRHVDPNRDVAYVFTGHGSHYAGMGRRLYECSPVFRQALDQCDEILHRELDRSLPEILFGDEPLLDRMLYAQPALLAFQHALATLWQSWGVRPSAVAGHSAGEYAAAVVAGVLSLEDGLQLTAARGRFMESLPGDGEMVAIFADEDVVARAVAPYKDAVGIAAVNGPTTTVISGDRTAVRAVLQDLALEDGESRVLDVSVAAHSPLVDPILDDFEQVVAGIELSPPEIPLVSSMTGTIVGPEVLEAGYWRRHLRQPVRFADVFATMRSNGLSIFVEIGPHPTLLGLGQRCWPDDRATWVPSLRRDSDEWGSLLSGLGTLYAAGGTVDWAAFDRPYGRRRVALPTYPFQREPYWSPAARPRSSRASTSEWAAASVAARTQAGQGPLDLQVETYPRRWELLDRLAGAYIVDALRQLGLFAVAGERVHPSDLVPSETIRPSYGQLVGRWLSHLVDDGLLERESDGTFLGRQPLPARPLSSLLEEADAAFEGVEPLLEYVHRCGSSLAAVVTGDESALSTLFPDGSYETVDFLYHYWPVARYFNAIVRSAASAAAGARPTENFRVLELGAGTGGTTATVIPALPGERTSYTFTDVSDYFLTRGAERFAEHDFMRYALLDIECSPEEQGFPGGGYDLVVAANVLHATRDLDATLRHALSLLAPAGLLLAYEATRHPRWFDITTGLIEGWQRFEDGWRGDHPLLPPDRWIEALGVAGFAEAMACPGSDEATAVLGQHVLLARAPGEATAVPARRHADAAEWNGAAAPHDVAPVLDTITCELADALPDERTELLVDFVRRAIARVLRIADPGRIQRDQPLLDLGFDSLMAVELRNVLRQGLGLEQKLPATLVFDHPSVTAIAAHLEGLMAGGDLQVDEATDSASPGPARNGHVNAEAIADLSEAEVEAMLLEKLAEI